MNTRLCGAVCASILLPISFVTDAAPVSGQGTWETTLQARDLDGNAATIEAYYDTVLDITWLADADNAPYHMFWEQANDWAAGLNVSGITGWRLPSTDPVNGSFYNTNPSSNATTDVGFADSDGWVDGSNNPVSEMGHMYYVTLGNLGLCNPAFNLCSTQSGAGLNNTAQFSNIQSDLYWSSSNYSSTSAWVFNFDDGDQYRGDKFNFRAAWAVHDGDISAAVPVPGAIWLLSSGLLGLVGMARRNKAA